MTGESPSDSTNRQRPSDLTIRLSRFEQAWQSGTVPEISEFLPADQPSRNQVLLELVSVDLEYRWRRASDSVTGSLPPKPQLEDYTGQYADLGELGNLPLGLICEEYRVRWRWGDRPRADDYLHRFPRHGRTLLERLAEVDHQLLVENQSPDHPDRGRRFPIRLNCPDCENPFAVDQLGQQGDVVCPGCGSTFHLDHEGTASWLPDRLPQLGKFQLLEAVGRGSFGTVYRARDKELERTVAVKVPRNGTFVSQEDEDRFLREARNVAQLSHPGMVPVHQVGRSATYPYIVTDFVEGVTLTDTLTSRSFDFSEIADLVAKMADVLQYAHENGVIHRDLKPSNIMITQDDQVRIMDFGLAKRDAGEVTMTLEGQILGTPAYMSPEQARGEGYLADARSDVYSLGVILFQMLTGELPFRGNTRLLLHQVIHQEARRPQRCNPAVPRDLDTICLKCLEKDSHNRFESIGRLAEELRRYLAGRPIHSRPTSWVTRAWRWSKRNPTVAALATAVLILLGVSCYLLTQLKKGDDFPAEQQAPPQVASAAAAAPSAGPSQGAAQVPPPTNGDSFSDEPVLTFAIHDVAADVRNYLATDAGTPTIAVGAVTGPPQLATSARLVIERELKRGLIDQLEQMGVQVSRRSDFSCKGEFFYDVQEQVVLIRAYISRGIQPMLTIEKRIDHISDILQLLLPR